MRDFGAIVRVSPRVMGDQRHEVPMGDMVVPTGNLVRGLYIEDLASAW